MSKYGEKQDEPALGRHVEVSSTPWFPCVEYEVDGEIHEKIYGEGVWKDTWTIGQKITVLYKPETPEICMVEGDVSYKNKMKLSKPKR